MSLRPFGSLQVVVSLFKLPDVFVELLLDAACLAKVILEHRNLFVTLGVLLLQLLLKMGKQKEEKLGPTLQQQTLSKKRDMEVFYDMYCSLTTRGRL